MNDSIGTMRLEFQEDDPPILPGPEDSGGRNG
jgi:hypothetical protein